MRRRLGILAVVTAVLLASGCRSPAPPVVVTTIRAGDSSVETDDKSAVAVDGVSLVAPDQLGALPGRAPDASTNQPAQLVVSNFLTESGRYSGDLARAMLTDPAARGAVVSQVVEAASGFETVQVSLFKLASQDSAALVDFAAELRGALPEDTSLVLTIISSTDFGGYRERGIDVKALSEHVDRFVLQTYEPAEADVAPDPIDDAAGLVEEIDYFTSQVDAERVDLGVSPRAGVDAEQGLQLATDAGLHGLVVGPR